MKISKKVFCILGVVIFVLAGFGIGIWVGATQFYYYVPQPENIDFSLFWDAYDKLQENFVNPEKIDSQKIIYGAISGMAGSLGDPFTNFFDPAQAKMFTQDLSGSFDGIGVEVGQKKGLLTVIAPLQGTPGQKAGLKSGDIITKIDGKDTSSLTVDAAVNLIRGEKATSVNLTIFREGWKQTKDFKITRETIIIPTMKWELKDSNVAYIQIYQFGETLPVDFKTAALEILSSPAKKIVLDLRDDPGGYLEVAQEIAGWFLQKGQTITIEDFGNKKSQQIFKSEGNAAFAGYPIVVLINQGSASASEILSGALRDNRNAKLVGAKSFGKGSVQEVLPMRDGSFLKITIAKWLTPNGSSISDIGLDPDIGVDITDNDIAQKKDPQLDKALEIAKDLK